MKKQFKKIIATVLTTTMIMSIGLPAFANENNYVTDTTVDIVTNDAFQELFSMNTNVRSATEEATIEQVTYEYTFTQQEDNSEVADVTLSFVLTIDGQDYPVTASGTVDAYHLSSGDILWENLIRGNATINDTDCKVLVGFSKLDSSSDIQVSVTLQSLDVEKNFAPLVFVFGNQVITAEVYQDLSTAKETHEIVNLDTYNVLATTSTDEYVMEAMDAGYFVSGYDIPGYAHHGKAYFNNARNHIAIAVRTFGNNVDNYFSETGTSGTTVKSFTSRLMVNDAAANKEATISSIYKNDMSVYDFTSGNRVILYALFEDILSMLDVPTATITTIFSTLRGSIDHEHFGDDSYVTINFGLTDNSDFDSITAGVPIVFHVGFGGTTGTYAGNSPFTFETDITYLTTYFPTGSAYPAYIYIDSDTASASFDVTLTNV